MAMDFACIDWRSLILDCIADIFVDGGEGEFCSLRSLLVRFWIPSVLQRAAGRPTVFK